MNPLYIQTIPTGVPIKNPYHMEIGTVFKVEESALIIKTPDGRRYRVTAVDVLNYNGSSVLVSKFLRELQEVS